MKLKLPKKSTLLQILIWSCFWMVPSLFTTTKDTSIFGLAERLFIVGNVACLILINSEWLLPKFYFRQKNGLLYGLISIVALVSVAAILPILANIWPQVSNLSQRPVEGYRGPPNLFVAGLLPLVLTHLGNTLYEVTNFATLKDKEAALYRSEKLDAELKFLKSQINPHFLFNALNNVYALTVIKSDRAPENLLKLSDMLRYLLYDCREDTVALQKEFEYIRNYIDLCLLKDSRGMNVKVSLDERRPNLKIAPMLLIPFIENAFKHAKIEDLLHGYINIEVQTTETGIQLDVKNSLPAQPTTKDNIGGIGLENVGRQLALLYPHRHTLEIKSNEKTFSITMKINLTP